MDTQYLRTYAESADDNTLAHGLPLTDLQRDLLGCIDRVGPNWAQRALEYDREAKFPMANWHDLREMGFLGLCVPKRHGGLGADYRTYMLVASRIGYYCGSTANTFNMHNANALWTSDMVDALNLTPDQRERHEHNRKVHYAHMLNGSIYAQPFSEGSGAAAGRHHQRADPAGVQVHGQRVFGAHHAAGEQLKADVAGQHAQRQEHDPAELLVPRPDDDHGSGEAADDQQQRQVERGRVPLDDLDARQLRQLARVEAQPADMGAEDDMEALMGEVLSFRQARPGA